MSYEKQSHDRRSVRASFVGPITTEIMGVNRENTSNKPSCWDYDDRIEIEVTGNGLVLKKMGKDGWKRKEK